MSAQRYINENRNHDQELEEKLAKSDGLNRAAQNRRRQHSATLAQKKDHLSERGREGIFCHLRHISRCPMNMIHNDFFRPILSGSR